MAWWNREIQRRAKIAEKAQEKCRKGGINSRQLVEIQEAIDNGDIEKAEELMADYGDYYPSEY